MTPEISVVLPVWNAESTIERAVRSILDQTFGMFELIVIDDGSVDRTSEILRGLSDNRLQLVQTEHQGVAAAANLGNQLARAPFIARMDADDYAHPDRLACQLSYLKRNKFDVVGSRIRIQTPSGLLSDGMDRYERWINEDTITPEQIQALRFVEFPLVNPSILARRDYFSLRFTESSLPEDYDLMLRASHRGMSFGKAPEVLLSWYDTPFRMTRTDLRYSRESFMECRRFHFLKGPLCCISTVDLWGAGPTGKLWLRWLKNSKIAVRKLIDISERKLGQTIHGVPVIGPEQLGAPDGTLMIVAVGAAGARSAITKFLSERRYCIGGDVWFVS